MATGTVTAADGTVSQVPLASAVRVQVGLATSSLAPAIVLGRSTWPAFPTRVASPAGSTPLAIMAGAEEGAWGADLRQKKGALRGVCGPAGPKAENLLCGLKKGVAGS